MGKWNEEAAPNNNLNPKTISTSKLVDNSAKYEFSKEPYAPGKKDQITKNMNK
jgi:hypothetical protein